MLSKLNRFVYDSCYQYGKFKILCHRKSVIRPCRRDMTFGSRNIDKESYLNKKQTNKGIDALGLMTLVIPVGCTILGIWQIKRKIWKDELCANLSLRTQLPTIDLPEDLTNRKLLEYRKVHVKGTFDHACEMYMGPRGRLDNEGGGMFFSDPNNSGNVGYFVITPLQLSDRNLRVLVNRGWVPADKKDPRTRLAGQIEGEVELDGVVRLREEASTISIDYNPETRVFPYRDLTGMADVAKSSFLYIDATKDSTVEGGPIGGQTVVKIRNEHFQYIITWFGLAFITGYLWCKRYVRRM